MRDEIAEDSFMSKCCLENWMCSGRIEWHHHLKFAGKRVNEKWCILPLCYHHHKLESQFSVELVKVMVSRATYEELQPYSKAIDYVAIKRRYDTN